MSVGLDEIKKLRSKTGAGIGDCKKALQEAGGDLLEAEKILKKQGLASAAKRSERSTSEGRIFVGQKEGRLIFVELLCETDFVAMNEQFLSLGKDLVEKILAEGSQQINDALHLFVQERAAVLKENIVLATLQEMDYKDTDLLSCYMHNQSRIAVAVKLKVEGQPAEPQSLEKLCHDLALHVAAMAPQFLSVEQVNSKFLQEQEEIFRALAAKDGIAEKILPNYVKGKLNKLLAEICFSEQNFVKADKKKVKAVLADMAKEQQIKLSLADFRYMKIGAAKQ